MRLLALLLVLGVATPAWADDRVEKARQAVLTDDYQPDLPDLAGSGSGSAAAQVPHERPGPVHGRDDRYVDTRESTAGDNGPIGQLFTFLMWGVLIVGLALMLFWLVTELVKYGGDDVALGEDKKTAEAAAEIDLAVIARPLEDAEELARRGEFNGAIHTLLLRTLQELVRSSAVSVAPAMTSREILARVPLLADAREALTGLITAVEITHFGDDVATQADYERCRAQFQVFAAAFRAGAARAPQGSGTAVTA